MLYRHGSDASLTLGNKKSVDIVVLRGRTLLSNRRKGIGWENALGFRQLFQANEASLPSSRFGSGNGGSELWRRQEPAPIVRRAFDILARTCGKQPFQSVCRLTTSEKSQSTTFGRFDSIGYAPMGRLNIAVAPRYRHFKTWSFVE